MYDIISTYWENTCNNKTQYEFKKPADCLWEQSNDIKLKSNIRLIVNEGNIFEKERWNPSPFLTNVMEALVLMNIIIKLNKNDMSE